MPYLHWYLVTFNLWSKSLVSCRWRKESMGIVDENDMKNGLTRENVLWVVRAQISLLQVACHRAHVCKSSWWTMDRKSWPSQVKSKVRRGKKKELYDLISHNNKELLHGFVVPKVRKKTENWTKKVLTFSFRDANRPRITTLYENLHYWSIGLQNTKPYLILFTFWDTERKDWMFEFCNNTTCEMEGFCIT